MSDRVDIELLRQFVSGEERAFELLFARFAPCVRAWSLRIVRDASAADDVTVEAFWRAYRARARFDPSRSFGAWLRRIATNAALDHLRAWRTWRAAASFGGARRVDVAADIAEAVADAFAALPPRLRLVATLALVEGESYADIGDALGIPIGTVKSRVFRATRRLRADLLQETRSPGSREAALLVPTLARTSRQ